MKSSNVQRLFKGSILLAALFLQELAASERDRNHAVWIEPAHFPVMRQRGGEDGSPDTTHALHVHARRTVDDHRFLDVHQHRLLEFAKGRFGPT